MEQFLLLYRHAVVDPDFRLRHAGFRGQTEDSHVAFGSGSINFNEFYKMHRGLTSATAPKWSYLGASL